MVDDRSIAKCLARHQEADAAALELMNKALEHGGKDNITVVLAQYSIPQLPPAPLAKDTTDYPPKPPGEPTDEFPGETSEFDVLR